MGVVITRVPEPEIGVEPAGQLRDLLRECFPDYPDRTYFKVPPHFRFLASEGDTLLGQVGIELRYIRAGDRVLRTFGVVDLAVTAGARSGGLAGRLLAEMFDHARACDIEFVLLFADDDRVYVREGWVRVGNRLTWVKIHEHNTLGLSVRVDTEALMVRPVAGATWPDGDIDLLGHVF